MRGSIRLFKVFGININVHITFFLLLAIVAPNGIRYVFLVIAIFFFVTMHEICHSLVAKRFGIPVHEITLLPIGGVSAMSRMPEKPSHELLISLAGPVSNIAAIVILYFPMKAFFGPYVLFHPLSTGTWPLTFAYAYWINIMLAGFNLLPAFPMDGGRILRAILASRIGYRRATKIAVTFGHVFALIFAYFGILHFRLILILIAVFVYMAASSEKMQVDIKETLKKIRVRDILPRDFFTIRADTTLSQVLESVFRSHQEDFPVVDGDDMTGFVSRQDIMSGVHRIGTGARVAEIMRANIPSVRDTDSLVKVQNLMNGLSIRALPVFRDGRLAGVITLEDISRAYALISQKP